MSTEEQNLAAAALEYHEWPTPGKISVTPTKDLTNQRDLALAYSLPDDARFIVSGLELEYLKKARGVITATGEPPIPRTAARAHYDVPVVLRNAAGAPIHFGKAYQTGMPKASARMAAPRRVAA